MRNTSRRLACTLLLGGAPSTGRASQVLYALPTSMSLVGVLLEMLSTTIVYFEYLGMVPSLDYNTNDGAFMDYY